MNRMRRLLAMLSCLGLVAAAGFGSAAAPLAGTAESGGTAKQIITDTESGESAEQLLKEDEAVWTPAEGSVPTDATALDVAGKSAVLLEQSSGQVLFEKNAKEHLPIASVTKVMTLLLVMEAIDEGLVDYGDQLTCSAYAASMGGSQIWLEEGEIMTVHELLKAATVVSANDACAMLAEHVSGSVEGFVQRMNERAAELGMNDTKFLDCSGLNDEAYSCAYDVALMSRELMKHPKITEYTTIWMDSLRDGKSELVNTNKLIRHYSGATGLKTGTTSTAGHCLSATATRDGMGLVAVILGCETTADRFGGARKMLDFGFANYSIYTPAIDPAALTPVPVLHGLETAVTPVADQPQPLLMRKGQESKITCETTLASDVEAPVEEGQVIGEIVLKLEGETLATYAIRAQKAVDRLTFGAAFGRLFHALCH